MADQAQQTVKGAPQQAQNAGGGIQGATSGILSSIEGWGNWIAGKGKAVVDRIFPPEQRSKFLAAVQSFMLKNPKLSVSYTARSDVRSLVLICDRPSSA